MYISKRAIGAVIGIGVFAVVSCASAASEIRFVPPNIAHLDINRSFDVGVEIDSNEPLNAYTLGISFDTAALSLESVSTAGSLITIWQTQPKIEAGGTIKFNGASITPFSGTNGNLLRMRFRAKGDASSTTLSFLRETAVYLANGKGTRVSPGAETISLILQDGEKEVLVPGTESTTPLGFDIEKPAITFSAFDQDPVNPDQKLFAFLATDSGSGIRIIETRERSWLTWGDWQTAQNPMAYGKNTWSVELRVVDNAGNIATKTVYDLKALALRAAVAVPTLFVLIAWLM